MIKAVIFDFDGTIIDTETVWYEIYRDLLKENHQYYLELADFVKVVGTTNASLFDHIDQALGSPLDRKSFKEEALIQFQRLKDQLAPREGFLKVLEEMKSQQLQLAVASSSRRDWVVGFLDFHGLTEHFPIIFTSDDVKNVKPDPELYVKTIEALGAERDEVLAVEDSVNGSTAAIKAGIHCLIIPNDVTKGSSFDKNAQIIDSYQEFDLAHYLKKDNWI